MACISVNGVHTGRDVVKNCTNVVVYEADKFSVEEETQPLSGILHAVLRLDRERPPTSDTQTMTGQEPSD
jgi:hypothetical protein